MNIIPEKIRNQTPYQPVSGQFDIRIDANESPFDLPEKVRAEFLRSFVQVPIDRYPDPTAAHLRSAFGARYGVPAENVVAGNGSDELISLILSTFLAPGERLGVVNPDFSMYTFYADLAGAEICSFQKPADEVWSLDAFSEFICREHCRAAILSNPCNPTGSGQTRQDMLRFIERTPVLLIIDEAYMDFWSESILDRAVDCENVIVLRTLSKAFGAAACRVGFAVSSRALTDALNVVRSPYNVNALSQLMGQIILTENIQNAHYLAAQAKELKTALQTIFKNGRVYDTHTNFVYVTTPAAASVAHALAEKKIAVRLFGTGALRITATNEAETAALLQALDALKEMNL